MTIVSPQPATGLIQSNQLTYVYLSSPPHSGSTLIACLLGVHPGVSTVGEFGTPFDTSEPCSCGVPYNECGFWKKWQTLAVEHGIDFELGNLDINLEPVNEIDFHEPDRIKSVSQRFSSLLDDLYFHLFPMNALNRFRDLLFKVIPARNRRCRAVVDRSEQLARILCGMEGTSVFLDTTKNPFQSRFLSQSESIDLKVIDLVRDGRGVMNSLMSHYSLSAEKAIACWLWATRNTARITKDYLQPEQVFSLRIEDLWANPERTVQELCQFIGIEDSLELDDSNRSDQHLIGNKMRLTFDGEIRTDEKWKRMLSQEDLAIFEKLAGDRNRELGY